MRVASPGLQWHAAPIRSSPESAVENLALRSLLRVSLFSIACGFAKMAHAQPTPTPAPAAAPANYQGRLTLTVDISDLDRRLFRVRETIPVVPGAMKLWYPEWLPGNHAPRGPIEAIGGLLIKGNGQRIEWTRDPVDVYAFHLTVPEGVSQLDIAFDYATPFVREQGRIVSTPEIAGLQWNAVLLYPATPSMAGISVQANLKLPPDWDSASALEELTRTGDLVSYQPVALETLVDSPVFAGRNLRRVPLASTGGAKVALNIVGDTPNALDATTAQLGLHAKLVREAEVLFGARHFDRYDFLLAVSEFFSGIGLEHHRSSENAVSAEYFTEWDKKQIERGLLPHEYAHSWVGKFRRPAGQMVGNFNTPLKNELLWVYEGQDQFWGQVLAARSGLWSQPFARESIAYLAAVLDTYRPGRESRSLQDTVNQPLLTARRPLSWTSWQRTEDYYNEGLLIWLDADSQLRELSKDTKSLEDFAKAFFGSQAGMPDDAYAPKPVTFEDVTAGLSAVVPYDWTGFLRSRLDGHGPGAPLKGLERSGWKLAFTEKPTEYVKGLEERNKVSDFAFSLGFNIEKDADLAEVFWGSPAFKAGLSKGDTVIAVNGLAYKAERLKTAVKNAKDDGKPIELLLKNLDHYRTVKVAYTGGLRYPTLERIEGSKDRLTTLLSGRAS